MKGEKDVMGRVMEGVEGGVRLLEEKVGEEFGGYVEGGRGDIMGEGKEEERDERGMRMGGMRG